MKQKAMSVRRGVAGYNKPPVVEDETLDQAPETKVIAAPPQTKVITNEKVAKKAR